VAFAVEGDGVGFATESYAASALYTTLASLSGALWRIRWVRRVRKGLMRLWVVILVGFLAAPLLLWRSAAHSPETRMERVQWLSQ